MDGSDAIMDSGVTLLVEEFIAQRLEKAGYAPTAHVPVDLLYSIELEAVSILIKNYQGFAKLCERLADHCQTLEEVHEMFAPPQLTNESTSDDFILDGLCLILAQNFHPDPFKMMLAARDSTWTPPPFYWALLKEPRVVETFRRLYDRNRGSEFLGAFFQDYCERVSSRCHLSEITAHFSIFTKAFSELLVEFLVDPDTYEFGDQDPHNISRLLCHAENAYCYAQALLHFLPYCQPQFASCRRLAQLIFRNLREVKNEFDAADRLLLCTALPNYPDLFSLFRSLKDTDRTGRIIISGQMIGNICDTLGKVIRRFEKHKTLLLFHEGRALPPPVGDEVGTFSEESASRAFAPPLASWESEMLRAEMEPLAEGDNDDGASLQTADIIQPVEWPVAAEVKSKSALPIFWNLPSASQAGDDELIEEEAEDENDRRGSTKLVLPPMEAIRETLLLDQLWEYLVCPDLPSHPANLPVPKLIELILMLTTLTNYELAVLHLQRSSLVEDEESSFMPPDEEVQSSFTQTQFLESELHFAAPWTPRSSIEEDDDFPPSIVKQQRKRPRIAAYASSIVSSYVGKSHVPSTLESCVYKDPHEGSRLRAYRSANPRQQAKLSTIFTSCQEQIEEYRRVARKELFDLYHISQATRGESVALTDDLMLQLTLRCQTSAGASAVLRFVEEALLPEAVYCNPRNRSPLPAALSIRVDPLQKITPALLTLLLRICIWHPRKRILVIALFKRVLEESFKGPTSATEDTQFLRRRLLNVAMSQLGLCEPHFEFSADDANRLPWRAIESDWTAAVIPGYKLVFHMIRELLPCFDVTLLRESLEFILDVCGTPYAAPFAERLCDLLRAVALLNVFDFALEINSSLRRLLSGFIGSVYATWAPDSPPEKVLQQCQVIAEAIGMSPEQMPIMPQDVFSDDVFSDDESTSTF